MKTPCLVFEARPGSHYVPHRVDAATLIDDPHAAFAALRSAYGVIQLGESQYLALRAADVQSLLTDPRITQVEGVDYARLKQIPDGVTSRFLSDFFLFSNDEAHRKKRRLFALTFTHRAVRAQQAKIRGVADEIVAGLPRGTTFDFIERMAARVPAEMIAGILGLPRSEASFFAGCVYDLSQAVTPVYPIDRHDEIEGAAGELYGYVKSHLKARLKLPKGDLLSTLVADWQVNPTISFESLVNQILGVIVGGSDTTRAAFAMLVSLLLEHPEQWAAVQADPTLIPGAISEAMRYEPSVGSIARFTTEELDIGGTTVPAGVLLSISTLSVMRDPALYAEPDRFDVHRSDHPRLHPVFGHGPHRCLGEMLARYEMQEALAALIASGSEIELVTPPSMLGFGGIRQITPMEVRLY